MKKEITPIEDTSFLHQIEICNFKYKDDKSDRVQAGVLAEDVELLKPELILLQNNDLKTVDYQYLFVCAIKELQKLKLRVDALEALNK